MPRLSISRRLLAVAMLGALTSALALYVLGWPLGTADRQRVLRARDGVEQELERIRAAPRPDNLVSSRVEGPMIVRSGIVNDADSFDQLEPPLWKQAPAMLHEAILRSKTTGGQVIFDKQLPNGFLAVGAVPLGESRYAWAADVLRPPQWRPVPSFLGISLGLLSLVLVVATLLSVRSVQRGAKSLKQSIAALSGDLAAPIPRPAIQELSEVADGIAALARDLSEAQKALAERERLALLGRVSAGLAHELRNPLASIKMQIDLACRQASTPRETAAQLGEAVDEILRLDRLVNDLLTVAVRRTGPREEVDLGDLVAKRAALVKSDADARAVHVHIAGNARIPVDSDSIARVIDNLIRNAVEASPDGGAVTIDIANGGKEVRVRVIDEGSGVPTDRREELFEPFFTTKSEGVGLGLALSRAIASAHGGTLAYDRTGGTTAFVLSLPAGEAA